MSSIDGIVFDLDGTLIDSAPDIAAAANRALADLGISIDLEQTRRFLGNGARRLMARVLAAKGPAASEERLDALTAAFEARYSEQPCLDSVIYPGVTQLLMQLSTEKVALGICTNKPQQIAERAVATLGLDRWISVVVGAGTHALKPDPEPLLACLSRLGLRPAQTLYVGDMPVDLAAGRAAGVRVALVASGYSNEPVSGLGADATFNNWDEAFAVITALGTLTNPFRSKVTSQRARVG